MLNILIPITVSYIDPGTGGMLFSILFGIFGSLMLFMRGLIVKLKFKVGAGKVEKDMGDAIPIVIFSDHNIN